MCVQSHVDTSGRRFSSYRDLKRDLDFYHDYRGASRAKNLLIADNIFDRGTHDLLNIAAARKEWLPTLSSNTYIQPNGKAAGRWGSDGKVYIFDHSVEEALKEVSGEHNADIHLLDTLYHLNSDSQSEIF